MSNQLALHLEHELGVWTADQIEVIRDQVAPKATDAELALFLNVAKASGLDPFRKQVYAIHRYDKQRGQVMTIQTGIDGYRVIAERTGAYMGNDDPVFTYEDSTRPYPTTATVTVWKLVAGQRCAFTATARWKEYVATKRDGSPQAMWAGKPHVMLAKCAEALALRKAFPGDLSGLYTKEEMDQADEPVLVEARTVSREQEHARAETRKFERDNGGWVDAMREADPVPEAQDADFDASDAFSEVLS